MDAVIDAAHRILADEGYARLSTNRIAQLAGISVGSLYHYFPSKEAVVAELARHLETVGLEMAREGFAMVAQWPIPEVARALVAILVSEEIGIVSARRTLLRHVPPRWFEETSLAADEEVRTWVTSLVEARRSEVRSAPADMMAFIIYHSVEGVVEAAAARRPELVSDPEFFEELLTMLLAYVRPLEHELPAQAD